MSSIGKMFGLFSDELDMAGFVILGLIAVVSIWLGYRYSRPSNRSPNNLRGDGKS